MTLRATAILLALVALSLLRSGTAIHYSFWGVDENQIVIRALGFIDGDLNPRWFGYHTLPMYLLGAFYYVEYLVFLALGLVSDEIEFVALLFSDHELFFAPARILFGFAHTLGCALVALAAHRAWGSRAAAAAVFAIAFLHPDAARAASFVRADTMVFLFLSATVYLACWAPPSRRSFIASLVSCAAAFASKLPAITLYPVLVLKHAWEVRQGRLPGTALAASVLAPPALVVAFMPYMLINRDGFAKHLGRIFSRASGEVLHVGKVHRYGLFERLDGIVDLVASQLGLLTLVLALLYVALSARARDSRALFCSAFIATYTFSFSTSATVDLYWLRPILPWIAFLAIGAIVSATAPETVARLRDRLGRPPSAALRWLQPVILAGFTTITLGFHAQGITDLAHSLTTTEADTRIQAAHWIDENIPADVLVTLEGNFPEYLPPLFTGSKGQTINMTPIDRRMLANPLLRAGWDHYYTSASAERSPRAVRMLKQHGYQSDKLRIAAGSYIVISSFVYDRYWEEHVIAQFPDHAKNVHDFYRRIRAQEHVAHFEGRGPRIDIYRMETVVGTD